MTKFQTAALCAIIVAGPVAWQWHQSTAATHLATATLAQLREARAEEEALLDQIGRVKAASARAAIALTGTGPNQGGNAGDSSRSQSLSERLRQWLSNPRNQWEDDLPCVRIPKSILQELDLQSLFNRSGTLSERALDLLAMTGPERQAAEDALGKYWTGVDRLMAIQAYETNRPSADPTRLTKTVIVPPLGNDLKAVAENTRAQLVQSVGSERERLLFGGWEEGAIQLFWPGNLWRIAEVPQEFTVWVAAPSSDSGPRRFGASWNSSQGGTSSDGSLGILPPAIAAQYFAPWLREQGVTELNPPSP